MASDSDIGTISFRLRVGVTGHRRIPDDPRLTSRVREALERYRALAPASESTPTRLALVSPLAEGADRLVAREALQIPEATLEAPLPLPEDEYSTDFETEESKREFDALLGRAEVISILAGADTRDEAYERVGRYVVDYCDALIALWDGQPSRGEGGTADIVAYARRQGRPLIWINTVSPFELTEQLGEGILPEAFRELDRYNGARADRAALMLDVRKRTETLLGSSAKAGLDIGHVKQTCEWILPYYSRADMLADRLQGQYRLLSNVLFFSAATAVAVVAAQVLFVPEHPWLGLFEVAFLVTALAALFLGRRFAVHERWISYRFLAERFRSALFLAIAGVEADRKRLPADERLPEDIGTSKEWLDRAFGEAWTNRPQLVLSEDLTPGLKGFITSALIDDQLKYHESAARRYERRHRRLMVASYGLFAVTLVTALLHTAGVGPDAHEGLNFTNALIFLAIALPAVAGAVGGIHAQGQYERHFERSQHMAARLEAARDRMQASSDRAEVAEAAWETETVLLEENRDWVVVMRFQGLRLTT